MGDSLGAESGTEVGSSTGLLNGGVERKIEGSSGVSENIASEKRVVMAAGTLAMGADTVAVAAEAARSSALRSCV